MTKLFIPIILFAIFCFAVVLEADACSCKGRPQGVEGVQTCGAYWNSDAVFTGLAEEVSIDRKIGQMKVTFLVEKPIRGVKDKKVDVFTSSDTASCGYPFKQGERYFVYADESNGKLSEGLCGWTTPMKNAEDDLEYVREIESGKSGTRIFGTVFEDRQKSFGDKRTFEKLSGIDVKIIGQNTFTTTTDENGGYLFKEIPFDDYQVIAKFPEGLREIFTRADLTTHYAFISKDSRRCDTENFVTTRQGSIRGKVVNFDGKKIKNPWNPDPPQPQVSLIPLDENNKILPYQSPQEKWAYRYNKYEFFFNVVPAGKYLLAINPNNCPYPNNGMPAMFFPGVADPAKAKIIELIDGEQLVLEDFRSLSALEERLVSGVVILPDGTPVADAKVRIEDQSMNNCNNFRAEATTDKNGHFKIKVFKKYKYRIVAFSEKKTEQKRLSAKPVIVPEVENDTEVQIVLDRSY